jgi:hypothetical protein
VYFFLPFILGLIGLMYHANKDLKVYVLRFAVPFTGIALKIYLNERPSNQEKEIMFVSFYVLLSGLVLEYMLYMRALQNIWLQN